MLIKTESSKVLKGFIQENKNLHKEEQRAKRRLPHLRYIKLYKTRPDGNYYPIGQFRDKLPIFGSDLDLTKKSTYKSERQEPEQDYVCGVTSKERTGLIVMKTGRGKSHIIMKTITARQEKSLIVVHSVKALLQFKEPFKEFCGIDVALYYGKKKDVGEITITTKKSFIENTEVFAKKFGLLFIDEADTHLNLLPKKKRKGGEQRTMIDAIIDCNADGLYGLTGTPSRKEIDDIGLSMIYGPIIKLEGQENNGYNYLPNIERYVYSDGSYSFSNIAEARELVMADEKRFRLQGELVYGKYKTNSFNYAIVMLERVEKESVPYYNKFKEKYKDMPMILINGDTKESDDDKNIAWLKEQGRGIIICTVGKMGRGIDVPILDAIFIFFPWSSSAGVVQACGRVLRKAPEKEPTIYDWIDYYGMFKAQGRARDLIYQEEYPGAIIKTISIKTEDT